MIYICFEGRDRLIFPEIGPGRTVRLNAMDWQAIGYNFKAPDPRPARCLPVRPVRTARAKVAELVDALDLESSGETRESSSLSFRTSSS